MSEVTLRPVDPADPADVRALSRLLHAPWGTAVVVSRGTAHDAAQLPGFLAELRGAFVGALTYRPDGAAWEVVTIDARRIKPEIPLVGRYGIADPRRVGAHLRPASIMGGCLRATPST